MDGTMHEDMTEHRWHITEVLEQGEWLPVMTVCDVCGLTTYDLLADQIMQDIPWPLADLEQRVEG